MKRSHLILMVFSILLGSSLLLGFSGELSAQPFGGHHSGPPGKGFFSSLTDEQQEVVWQLITQMREQGASREEIHKAVVELLFEWGIQLPERPGGPDGPHGPRSPGGDGKGFWEELTEEQRAAIRSQIFELWQDGIAHREIHEAVGEMLEGYGIELPERHEGPHGPGGYDHPHFTFMPELSEEQRQELHQMVGQMRQGGATREEIRAAVEGKLAEWGIDLSEPPPELTQEQRTTLRAVIFELWQNGATEQEIRSAAAEQLQSWSLQLPEGHWRHGGLELFGFAHRCLRSTLSEEESKTLHETFRDMRRQGATPEEIREAVRDLLETWGINPPELDAELTSEQRAQLRASVFELWMAGASHEKICAAIEESLGDFGIDLPEDWGDHSPQNTPTESPIQAQNYPNPANPQTQIQFALNVAGAVQVQIYNISGQLVRAFDMGYLQPGSYNVTWDGRRHDGIPVASGVYLYRIQAGLHSVTNRMVLLK